MVFITPFITVAVMLAQVVVAAPSPVDLARRSSEYNSNSYDSSKNNYDSSSSKNNYDSGSSKNYEPSSKDSYDSSSSNYESSPSKNNYDSSSSKNNYDSSKDSKSSYDSSKGYDSSYDSSKNYDSSKGYDKGYDSSKDYTTSKKESKTTSTKKSYATTTYEKSYNTYTTTSTSEYTYETTSTADKSETSTYGSGSYNYGSDNGYDNCVQQCMASFPSATGTYESSSSSSNDSEGTKGTGATKTIIVAPSQGVLRYFPFAVNASVGDTILFKWGANGHTVTSGSALLPCNGTADDAAFNSGLHDKDFSFTQEVTTTEPMFFFCNAPTHCQKGMFGVVNPGSDLNGPTSASGMMQSLVANNPDLKAYAALTDKATEGTGAEVWGGNINMGGLPGWAQPLAAESILFTRNVLASNRELLRDDGSIDMSTIDTTPLLVPGDLSAALSNAGNTNAGNTVANAAGTATVATVSATGTTVVSNTSTTNGAGALASPRMLVAMLAVGATLFLL